MTHAALETFALDPPKNERLIRRASIRAGNRSDALAISGIEAASPSPILLPHHHRSATAPTMRHSSAHAKEFFKGLEPELQNHYADLERQPARMPQAALQAASATRMKWPARPDREARMKPQKRSGPLWYLIAMPGQRCVSR